MNLPNKLSLLRVALIPVMVALMLPQTLVCDLLAAAVFAVAALTDYFDGHIARSRHLITDFGKFIDPVADKLLNLSAMMMLVQRGTLPGWVVVLILARELAVDGLRMVAGSSLAVQYFSKSVAFVPAVSMAPVAALVFTATRGSIGSPSAL